MRMFGEPKKQESYEHFCGKLVMYGLLFLIPYWFIRLVLWLGEKYLIPAMAVVFNYTMDHFWILILFTVMVVVLAGIIEMSIKDKE